MAVAVVRTALDLNANEADGDLMESLLSDPHVRNALAGADALPDLLCRLAITLARGVLEVWRVPYPNLLGPVEAVEACEAWVRCPCPRHADDADAAAALALEQAQARWRHEPKAAAWAGRTAAWAGAAPKSGWQAIAAIVGACNATTTDGVVSVAERFFAQHLS